MLLTVKMHLPMRVPKKVRGLRPSSPLCSLAALARVGAFLSHRLHRVRPFLSYRLHISKVPPGVRTWGNDGTTAVVGNDRTAVQCTCAYPRISDDKKCFLHSSTKHFIQGWSHNEMFNPTSNEMFIYLRYFISNIKKEYKFY